MASGARPTRCPSAGLLPRLNRAAAPSCCLPQALGPRSIPTAAAVEAELQKLRVGEGRAPDAPSSDDDDDDDGGAGGRRCRTALAQDPADYFGFCG